MAKLCPKGTELFHVGGHIDQHDKAIICISQMFCDFT